MAENGFARVSAVDYSEASIVAMRNAQRSRVDALRRNPPDKPPPHPFEVDYRVMDVTAMTYPERSFDCVVDKATLDTMCQLDDEPDEAAPPVRRRRIRSRTRTRDACWRNRAECSSPGGDTCASRTASRRRGWVC